jgi:hypothetical protein
LGATIGDSRITFSKKQLLQVLHGCINSVVIASGNPIGFDPTTGLRGAKTNSTMLFVSNAYYSQHIDMSA